MEEVADTSEMQPNVLLFGRTVNKGLLGGCSPQLKSHKSAKQSKFAHGPSYSDPHFVIAIFQSMLLLQLSSLQRLLKLADGVTVLESHVKNTWLQYVKALEENSFFCCDQKLEEMKQVRRAVFFSTQILPAILLFGCWKCQLSILGQDMIQWMSTGKVPYFNAFNMLPKELRLSHLLHSSYHIVFIPSSLPTAKDLENMVFQLCTLFADQFEFGFPLPTYLVSLGLKLSLPGNFNESLMF